MPNKFIHSQAPTSSLLDYHKHQTTTLFLGSEFLFSHRLFQNLKRGHSVIPFDVGRYEAVSSRRPSIADDLCEFIRYRKVDTLLFTSELFLLFEDSSFDLFVSNMSGLRSSYNIKIVFCNIQYPYPLQGSSFIQSVSAVIACWNQVQHYNTVIRSKLIVGSDLVLEFSSYLASGFNNFQGSFFPFPNSSYILNAFETLDFNANIRFLSADDISNVLLEFLSSSGVLSIDDTESSVNLDKIVSAIHSEHNIRNLLPLINKKSVKEVSTFFSIAPALITAHSQTYCSLDIVYRNNPSTTPFYSDTMTAATRIKLGKSLSSSIPFSIRNKLDFICPVPDTGKYYAQGLSNALKLPYIEAIIKASNIGRSFDIQDSSSRKDFILKKLAAMPDLLNDKVVGFVDEAIFTGSTLKIVSELAKRCNVKEIYFFIPTPECKQRCIFNMQPNRNILSEYIRAESLQSYFDVDGVFFQQQDPFFDILNEDHGSLCGFCFS